MEKPSQLSVHHPSVIPAWLVPFLSLPFRRLWDSPQRIVLPLVRPGDRILEVGPGSGFFTVPMARALGADGRVFCVELQEAVQRRLRRTLERRGLLDIVEVRACGEADLKVKDLEGAMDLVVAIHVLHEMPTPDRAIAQMASVLRPGGRLLVREPKGHCPASLFRSEVDWAIQSGLSLVPHPEGNRTGACVALFEKR
ncbi:class I SAM-dependent methyltransferase [Holophaga foetida]|uniref:class I SAM-dependent methyltransferase n=1 Tax=Holophaga foetida TaxID=35839 RepID=UPI00024742B7|nr:methyltransferase domain-containing protein [Holophaga foetida]